MVQINFAKREVACKVVYYGPEQAGKTTNLQQIYERSPAKVRGNLTTIATDTNRTLFFDFLPLNLGLVGSVRAKINLYAIPYIEGQNAVRLLVLEGVDGIVFVADSAPDQMRRNREALENLHENLNHLGRDPRDIPIVFQWNKRDLPDAVPADELASELNPGGLPGFEAVAERGTGIFNTLKAATHSVLLDVSKMVVANGATPEPQPVAAPEPPAPAPKPPPVILPQKLRKQPKPAMPEPEPEPEPVFAAASASSSDLEFDDVPLPPTDVEEPASEGPSVVPPWRQSADAGARLSTGTSQYHGALSGMAAPPQEDIPRAADRDADARPARSTSPIDTETALVEPMGGGGWSAPAEPVDEGGGYDEPEPAYEEAAYEEPAYDEPEPDDGGWEVEQPPAAPGRVRVGGPNARYSHGWESHSSDIYGGVRRRHDARPAVDRRRKPRLNENIETLSTASLVAGSLFALFTLVVVGVLVHQLL